MLNHTLERLEYLCNLIPGILRNIPEAEFSHKKQPTAWSKKEILGHLIDSAANNHQRFVRIQFEEAPYIVYDQNQWVACSRYQSMDMHHLVDMWETYNRHLLELIRLIPTESLQRKGRTNEPEPVTLEWLIGDYVVHMEHHMKQLVDY